ncbi:hypothetical protein J7643_10235 [bacterium]|nr:hypothetical protein [bacterium]
MTLPSSLLPGLAIFSALFPAAAPAAEAKPEASVSGVVFADYSAPTSGGLAGFNLTRAFLTGKVRFDNVWSGVITLNPYSEPQPNGGVAPHDVLLQNAYLQADGLYPGGSLQLGMVTLPWTEYEYAFWGYRMLGTVPLAGGIGKGATYVGTWDKGLKAMGENGPLSYALAVSNGEGFRANEADGFKAWQGRVSLTAPIGLELTALGERSPSASKAVSDRASVLLGFKSDTFRCALQGTRLWDQVSETAPLSMGHVLSAFEVATLPIPGVPGVELLLRGDYIEPSQTTPGDERLEAIAGLSFKPTKGVTLALDNQNITRYGATTTNTNVVALHTSLTF